MNEGGGEEQYENGKPRSEEDPQENKTKEEDENGRGNNDTRMEDRAGDSQEDAKSVEEEVEGDNNEKIEDNFLHMLRNSAGDWESLSTSWEPGRIDQFYFITTKGRVKRVEEWLYATMNHLLNKYGVQTCVRVLGLKAEEITKEESK